MHRRCSKRRPSKPYKKGIRLKILQWRGFKVEVWNTKAGHRLRYEWKLYPLSPSLRKKLMRKGRQRYGMRDNRLPTVFHDHTSTYCPHEAEFDGCGRANELLSLHRHLNIEWRMQNLYGYGK